MREVRNRYYTDTHDLRYDIRIKRLEMQKLFTDPKVDDATLLTKEKELSALKLKLMDRKAEMKLAWRKILTPEQIQKLGQMPSRHRH
jgi:Spy/CpxP family protein refolding chaperone